MTSYSNPRRNLISFISHGSDHLMLCKSLWAWQSTMQERRNSMKCPTWWQDAQALKWESSYCKQCSGNQYSTQAKSLEFTLEMLIKEPWPSNTCWISKLYSIPGAPLALVLPTRVKARIAECGSENTRGLCAWAQSSGGPSGTQSTKQCGMHISIINSTNLPVLFSVSQS